MKHGGGQGAPHNEHARIWDKLAWNVWQSAHRGTGISKLPASQTCRISFRRPVRPAGLAVEETCPCRIWRRSKLRYGYVIITPSGHRLVANNTSLLGRLLHATRSSPTSKPLSHIRGLAVGLRIPSPSPFAAPHEGVRCTRYGMDAMRHGRGITTPAKREVGGWTQVGPSYRT